MFGKRKFNNPFSDFDSMFNELDTFFSETKPLFYKMGPNGYMYTIRIITMRSHQVRLTI